MISIVETVIVSSARKDVIAFHFQIIEMGAGWDCRTGKGSPLLCSSVFPQTNIGTSPPPTYEVCDLCPAEFQVGS